jgi:hypothetical protein
MNKKHTYHAPKPHTLRVYFEHSYMDCGEFKSKAEALRNVTALQSAYKNRRIEVVPLAQ